MASTDWMFAVPGWKSPIEPTQYGLPAATQILGNLSEYRVGTEYTTKMPSWLTLDEQARARERIGPYLTNAQGEQTYAVNTIEKNPAWQKEQDAQAAAAEQKNLANNPAPGGVDPNDWANFLKTGTPGGGMEQDPNSPNFYRPSGTGFARAGDIPGYDPTNSAGWATYNAQRQGSPDVFTLNTPPSWTAGNWYSPGGNAEGGHGY